MSFLSCWLCVLLGLLLHSSEGGGGLVLQHLGPGLDHTHDLGHLLPVHLVLEHHAGHTGVLGNESLGRGLGET